MTTAKENICLTLDSNTDRRRVSYVGLETRHTICNILTKKLWMVVDAGAKFRVRQLLGGAIVADCVPYVFGFLVWFSPTHRVDL